MFDGLFCFLWHFLTCGYCESGHAGGGPRKGLCSIGISEMEAVWCSAIALVKWAGSWGMMRADGGRVL